MVRRTGRIRRRRSGRDGSRNSGGSSPVSRMPGEGAGRVLPWSSDTLTLLAHHIPGSECLPRSEYDATGSENGFRAPR